MTQQTVGVWRATGRLSRRDKAPQTERGLTHSPHFNGPLYQRMSEDLHLGDIDSKRMMVHIHRGKGAKDRYAKRREARGLRLKAFSSSLQPRPSGLCQHCGGELRMIGMTNAEGRIICRVLPDHATRYQESG